MSLLGKALATICRSLKKASPAHVLGKNDMTRGQKQINMEINNKGDAQMTTNAMTGMTQTRVRTKTSNDQMTFYYLWADFCRI